MTKPIKEYINYLLFIMNFKNTFKIKVQKFQCRDLLQKSTCNVFRILLKFIQIYIQTLFKYSILNPFEECLKPNIIVMCAMVLYIVRLIIKCYYYILKITAADLTSLRRITMLFFIT